MTEVKKFRADGEAWKCTVVGVMRRAAGVEVIDHRGILRKQGVLLRRVANDAFGRRQAAHADVGHIIVNRESRYRGLVTDSRRSAGPAGVIKPPLRPGGPERAVSGNQNRRRSSGGQQCIGSHVLTHTVGNVGELLGERGRKFRGHHGVRFQQGEVLAALQKAAQNKGMAGGHCNGLAVLAQQLYKNQNQFDPFGSGSTYSYSINNDPRLQRDEIVGRPDRVEAHEHRGVERLHARHPARCSRGASHEALRRIAS